MSVAARRHLRASKGLSAELLVWIEDTAQFDLLLLKYTWKPMF